MMKPRLLLIDLNNLMHRSYFIAQVKSPDLISYLALKTILNLYIKFKPTHIAIAMEKGDYERSDVFKEYKANREGKDYTVKPSRDFVIEALGNANIAVWHIPKWEADDVIATTVVKFRHTFEEIFIYGNDKDYQSMLQYENVRIVLALSEVIYGGKRGDAYCLNKFGVMPDRVAEYLAIVGDGSDNIPGVSGLGKVAAQKVINAFQTAEDLQEALEKPPEQLEGRHLKKLRENRKSFRDCLYLTSLKKDGLLRHYLTEAIVKNFPMPSWDKNFLEYLNKNAQGKLALEYAANAIGIRQAQDVLNRGEDVWLMMSKDEVNELQKVL